MAVSPRLDALAVLAVLAALGTVSSAAIGCGDDLRTEVIVVVDTDLRRRFERVHERLVRRWVKT